MTRGAGQHRAGIHLSVPTAALEVALGERLATGGGEVIGHGAVVLPCVAVNLGARIVDAKASLVVDDILVSCVFRVHHALYVLLLI